MTMKKYYIYIIGITAAMFTGCSEIDEADRLIDVEGVTAQRTVLLEDFTGQNCLNCPNAHKIAAELHDEYGENLIVVSMHAGSFGVPVDYTKFLGLMQPEGDEYAAKLGVENYPSGVINRNSGVLSEASWRSAVREAIQQTSNLNLEVQAKFIDENHIYVKSDLQGLEALNGKLQLWVLEDSIVAIQRMPNGNYDMEYIHNHVYRASINGVWGEDVDLSFGEEKSLEVKSYELNPKWDVDHISVVGIFYNEGGVLQAAKATVNNNKK